jgi:hypothetical protein
MRFPKSEIMKQFSIGITFFVAAVACVGSFVPARADDGLDELIRRVSAVGAQGTGSEDARVAREKLVAAGPRAIPYLLEGMDTTNVVAANWLRTAFDEVVGRAMKSDRDAIPVAALRAFVLDAKRQGRARRLALDVLSKLEPDAPAKLIPSMLDDPEFRRDAVTVALADGDRAAGAKRTDDALAVYTKAFDAARDADQVRVAATKLKSLGREVSIAEQMGFLVDWHIVGPFDGPEFNAFTSVFPPEKNVGAIDLAASYDGARGKVSWKRHRTPDDFGTVDLVKAVAATDDAAAYAFASIESPAAREVQIRGGADDNFTIWLNGERVFAKDEWQNGTRLDRFIVPVRLRAGRNEILVKVCQGPKYRDPAMANPWSLQLRICDPTGRGIVFPTVATRHSESDPR